MNERFLITAPSVEFVDEWFRNARADGLVATRHSPEFYTYTYDGKPWIYNWSLGTGKTATASSKSKIFFSMFNNAGGFTQFVFPSQFAPNHISHDT